MTGRTKGREFIGASIDLDLKEQIINECISRTIKLRKIYPNASKYTESQFLRDAIENWLKERGKYE